MPAGRRSKAHQEPGLYFFAATILVSDRSRSVEWYTKKLGFQVVQDLGHWVTVGHPGQTGLLHLCQGSEIDEPLEPGNQGITFHLRGNFEDGCAELARKGVKFHRPVTERPWGKFAQIEDPDGNVITVNPED